LSSFEDRLEVKKRQQEKGERLEKLEGELPDSERTPTLYEKSAEMVTQKLFSPQDMHEKQLMSNIPKQILTNIMNMQAIEQGMHTMIDGPTVELVTKEGKEMVLIYDTVQIIDKDGKTTTKPVVKKKMTYKAYRRAKLYTGFMGGFTGNLLEELPAVEGDRADKGVTVVSALTNSEKMLLEAQSASQAGALKKIWRKIV
jgi:hypothetical protein